MQRQTKPLFLKKKHSRTCAVTTGGEVAYPQPRMAVGGEAEPAARSRKVYKQMLIFTNRRRCAGIAGKARGVWPVGVVLGWVLDTTPPPPQSSGPDRPTGLPGCVSDFGVACKADPEGVRGRFSIFRAAIAEAGA